MKQKNTNAAKFAFFYMLSLVALIFLALSTGMIIFQIINKFIADSLSQFRGGFSPHQLKFAISTLIIAAPVYYIVSAQIYKNLKNGLLNKDAAVRRWLTYFILFVTSVVMLGWLIATVNNFLNGELTLKFALKAITAVGIAAAVFTFYFYDIKRKEVVEKKDRIIQIYFYGSLILVLAVFAASLFFVESPAMARNRKIDNVTLDNFNEIAGAITSYYQENKKLPPDLEIIKKKFSYISDNTLKDFNTGKKLDYKIINSREYALCAKFLTSNYEENNDDWRYNKNWRHSAGYQCLRQTIHLLPNSKIPQSEIPEKNSSD